MKRSWPVAAANIRGIAGVTNPLTDLYARNRQKNENSGV